MRHFLGLDVTNRGMWRHFPFLIVKGCVVAFLLFNVRGLWWHSLSLLVGMCGAIPFFIARGVWWYFLSVFRCVCVVTLLVVIVRGCDGILVLYC